MKWKSKPTRTNHGTRWELTEAEAEALQHELEAARTQQPDGTQGTHKAHACNHTSS